MTITGIISAIIIGLIVGALGRLFAPGKQNISIIATIIVGIIAAFVGDLIIPTEEGDGFSLLQLIVQIALAVVGVLITAQLMGRRRTV